MSSRISEIITQVKNELTRSPYVAGLILAGSQVKGNKFPSDKFSDIELYVVAYDEKYQEAESQVQSIQTIFGDSVIFAYKNQWAGWSILFKDLLRLELPLVKVSDDAVFSRSNEQKLEIIYSKPNFKLKRDQTKKSMENESLQVMIEEAIKDFWYMAVYAVQHLGRGEVWLARDAVRISLQGKIKRLLQEIYHRDTLVLDTDRRLELTWSPREIEILKDTSSSYDRDDVIRALLANIRYMEELLTNLGSGDDIFKQYKDKLLPNINQILNNRF